MNTTVQAKQAQWGLPVTDPVQLYRSPSPEPPTEVAQLYTDEEAAPLTDEQQREWAERRIAANVGAFTSATTRAAPPVPAQPDAAQRRQELRDAIDAYVKTKALADAADQAVSRAAERVATVDAELEDYKQLDAKIVDFHSSEIRQGTDAPLPHSLATAMDARGRLLDRLDALHKAHAQLTTEARTAHAVLEAANHRRTTAASHIISDYADELARALVVCDARAALLRATILTIGDSWLVHGGGVSKAVGLSQKARDAILKPRDEPKMDRDFAVQVQEWFGRLLTDADASLDLD